MIVNACAIASVASWGVLARVLHSVMLAIAARVSFVSWSSPPSRYSVPEGRPDEMIRTGRDSAYEVPAATIAFSVPGPLVVMTTPGLPATWL